MPTFKELNYEGNIDKPIRKSGLSKAIIFSKEDILRFGLDEECVVRLNNAEIIKAKV